MNLFNKGRPSKELTGFYLLYYCDDRKYLDEAYFDSDCRLRTHYILIDECIEFGYKKIDIIGYYLKEDLIKKAEEK